MLGALLARAQGPVLTRAQGLALTRAQGLALTRAQGLALTRAKGPALLARALHLRLLSTHVGHLDSNQYITALYNKLSEKDHYEFLAPQLPAGHLAGQDGQLAASQAFKDFLDIMEESDQTGDKDIQQIQSELCEKFTSWSKLSQLRVGFLMYLDSRIQADDYLLKVIKHIGSGNLFDMQPHDLTALMLLIYFKRDLSVESLSDVLDLDSLMSALAGSFRQSAMSRDEVCACCLGLKRVEGLAITQHLLRKELYRQLQGFVSFEPCKLDDFFVVTLMTSLARGNLIFKDTLETVDWTMQRLQGNLANLSLDTAIKIMNFPLTLNHFHKEVEEAVVARAEGELGTLNSRDLRSLSNYFSKSPHPGATAFLGRLVGRLEQELAAASDLQQLADMVECFHYLSHKAVYSDTFNAALFSSLSEEPVSGPALSAGEVAAGLARALGLGLDTEGLAVTGDKLTAVFTRIPAFICSSYQIETEQKVKAVLPSLLFSLSSHGHRPLPIQLHSPAMDLRGLDYRTKQLLFCYRALAKFLGGEQYCRVARLLPHFTEPDIVFGHIGGISMTVPDYIWQDGLQRPRLPPPGDWHVLVMGTRKSQDASGRVLGQDAAKLSQLQRLGYTPLVVPYSTLQNPQAILKSLHSLLRTADVVLPNLDDGAMERRGRPR